MMKNYVDSLNPFTVFIATGAILRSGACQAVTLPLQARQPGEYVIAEAADDATEYVDLTWPEMPTLMPKQPIDPQVSTDGLVVTLSNLPKPCAVTVDGTRYETPDGEIEIEFALPGKYRITLAHPHYLTETLEVEL